MSNFDQIWNEQQQAQARREGWELGVVVDSGKALSTAYLDVFDVGPVFKTRRLAMQWVVAKAQQRSKLHIDALAACSSSKLNAAPSVAPRKKKA